MLQHTPVASRYPTWSPDGTLPMGMAMDPTYQKVTGLMLIDPDGVRPPITIETGDLAGDPSWQRVALP